MFDLKSQVLARKYVYLYLQDGRNDETSAKLINGEDIIRCVSSPFWGAYNAKHIIESLEREQVSR